MISLSGDEATKSYQSTIYSLEEQKNSLYKELIETKSTLEITENKLKSLHVTIHLLIEIIQLQHVVLYQLTHDIHHLVKMMKLNHFHQSLYMFYHFLFVHMQKYIHYNHQLQIT